MNKWIWILAGSLVVILIGYAIYTHHKAASQEEVNNQIKLAALNAQQQAAGSSNHSNVWDVIKGIEDIYKQSQQS